MVLGSLEITRRSQWARRSVLLIAYGFLLPRATGSTTEDVPPAAVSRASNESTDPIRFNRDVRPILADRCFHCHGPDEADRKATLRFDRADGPEGAYRVRDGVSAVRPGAVDRSELWRRVTTDDADDVMPPEGSHKPPLDDEQKDLLRRWIEQGAEYEEHWAFVPPSEAPAPEVANRNWAKQRLDRFVLQSLEAQGLSPSPRADRRLLLRRATFDLTGLPPTRDELQAFLSDTRPDAYERAVDELLSRPQYGEHMSKYWLDLVRFADSNGVHHDHYRELSPYRDWVIRSFNENRLYSEFVTDQIAGDLHPEATQDQLIGSGFNRLHMIIDVGTALPEESFSRNVIDRVTAVGTAFMGLTFQCAVCHDHKYDPITQKDFFQLSAFFNNLDAKPETGSGELDKRRGLQPPYINMPSKAQERALAELDRELATVRAEMDRLKTGAGAEVEKAALAEVLKGPQAEQKALEKKRSDVLRQVPGAMVMKERPEVRPAHVLIRGEYDKPGEEVGRATPSFLPVMPETEVVPSRMDLAKWLVSPDHPLTWRVAVNRMWQQFFGVGLVKTAEDFGTQGEWPQNAELLDHLARTYAESGGDTKALAKEIVLSATYQQSSAATQSEFVADPENRQLARGSRFRMDAEMVRDQILATSGLLNREMYGRSVKPPQPDGIWEAVTLPSSYPRSYHADTGDKIFRRSVYTYWKRGMPPPQMSLLNAPTRESCTARRERTNTSMQALLLLNEIEYVKAARHLALSVLAAEPSPDERLTALYETITSRLPDRSERAELLRLVADLLVMYGKNWPLAEQLCEGVGLDGRRDLFAPELAAWTMLTSAIYNLDITKTRE